jgi:hypothetical protein
VFGSVTRVVFQNTFRSKTYQNNVFCFFKKIIFHNSHENNLKHKKKFNKFLFSNFDEYR